MFSKELEALIEATLADGVLEDNEKAALVKRAQAEGVDLGELEIYINSIMQKRMQTKTAEEEARDAEHRREQQGNICPHCGTVIPPLTKICPNCGRATNANETQADKELQNIIDQLEKYLVEVKAGNVKEYSRNKATLEALIRKAEAFYGNDQKIKKILFELKEEVTVVERKISSRKKTIFGIIAAVVVALLVVGYFLYSNYQLTHDPALVKEKVLKYLNEDDPASAETYLFDSRIGWRDEDQLVINIVQYYLDKADYRKGYDYLNEQLEFSPNGLLPDYKNGIILDLLKKSDYENAILLQKSFYSKKTTFELFINQMIDNGDIEKAKDFVKQYSGQIASNSNKSETEILKGYMDYIKSRTKK